MNTRVRNTKAVHAFEMFDLIEKEKDVNKKKALLLQYGAKPPLNMLLSLNFNHTIELDLPEGMPPMDLKDMDVSTHPDFQGLLAGSIQQLKHCMKSSPLKKFKKEEIFYRTLANSPLKDGEILCAAKDHALEELYPSITAAFVESVFPHYVKESNAAV